MPVHAINDLLIERQYARSVSTQATANGTKTLTVADAPIQHFTGTTSGQIVQLPNATTLLVGTMYEVMNSSTRPVRINDGAASPALLAWVSQTRRARLVLIDNSTQAGVWAVDSVAYGANQNQATAAGPTTNNSQTTYVSAVSFTTEELPPGDYELQFWSYWNPANNNRNSEYQILEGATQIFFQGFFCGPASGTTSRYIATGMTRRTLAAAGSFTYDLQFRCGQAGGTTITVNNSILTLKRVS